MKTSIKFVPKGTYLGKSIFSDFFEKPFSETAETDYYYVCDAEDNLRLSQNYNTEQEALAVARILEGIQWQVVADED